MDTPVHKTKWDLPIKESATHIKEYCGIADCHGLESFTAHPSVNAPIYEIRAMRNRQRHAVVYVVRLREEDAERIRGLVSDDRYCDALEKMKEVAVNGEIKLSGGGNTRGSWELIPNPKLDPWG